MKVFIKEVQLGVMARSFCRKAHGSSVPNGESRWSSQERPSWSVEMLTWLQEALWGTFPAPTVSEKKDHM